MPIEMINPYEYIFYKIYNYGTQSLSWGRWGQTCAALNTITILIFILVFNLLTIENILLLNGCQIGLFDHFSSITSLLVVFAILFIPNYFLFINNRRYNKVAIKYGNETASKKLIGTILVLLYTFGTFVLFFITLAILKS